MEEENCSFALQNFFRAFAGFLALSREFSREKKREILQAVKQVACECDKDECEKWQDAV